MVSVRRPGGRKAAGSSSLFTFRNATILFILLQSLNLVSKVIRHANLQQQTTTTVPISDSSSSSNTGGSLRKPPPSIEIVRVHEAHQDTVDDRSDHLEGDEHHQVPADADNTTDNVNAIAVVVKATNANASVTATTKAIKQVLQPNVVLPPLLASKMDAKTAEVITKHGTGPTTAGYVVDFLDERQDPPYRKEPVTAESFASQVASAAGVPAVQSCDYLDSGQFFTRAACRATDAAVWAFNPADFDRTVCGKTVKTSDTVRLDKQSCTDGYTAHLFSQGIAPVSGHDMPPIRVQAQPGMFPIADDHFHSIDACDIPCEFQGDMEGTARYIAGTEWMVTQTDADPYYSDKATMERTEFRKDLYYSTTSLNSAVPLSFYNFEHYNLRDHTQPLDWETTANAATYVVDDRCQTSGTRRQKWFAAVAAAFDAKAFGSCQHNTDLGAGETVATAPGRIALMKKARMTLAFEAGLDDDHVTNVVWEALLSGAVPVILGATNVMRVLPANSAIDARSFNNWDTAAAYVKQVSENKTLWESYHAWRNDDKELAAFEQRFEFTRTAPECRLCRWAYAKMYGLGWDHQQQVVKEPKLGRQLCLDDSKKLVTKPFREVWVERGTKSGQGGSETCTTMTTENTFEMDSYKVTRKVTQHDGVTDIVVTGVETDSAEEDVVLRLEVDVRNTEGAFFRDTHTLVSAVRKPVASSASIQDEYTKVTVLANWKTAVYSPEEGTIEVVVQRKGETIGADDSRRIRIITEDINSLHDKMTEFFPSSFGKLMVKDFVDPLELYFVASS
jgi:hypothetical protein